MARHSKWHNIRVHKGKQDKIRGKTFAIHSKLISLAAQRGADPSKNPYLEEAILNAKKDNVPNDNIDRAIRRGAGLDKDAAQIEEVYYEGYGPGGVAIIAKGLTDNRNRTAPNVRHVFSKYGGSLGETGSVSNFAFRYKGVLHLPVPSDVERFEEAVLNSDAEDYSVESEGAKIVCDTKKLSFVVAEMKSSGFPPESSDFEYLPNTEVEVGEFDKAFKVYRLVSDLEEDEDIETVWHNAAISDEMVDKIEEAIESSRFRT